MVKDKSGRHCGDGTSTDSKHKEGKTKAVMKSKSKKKTVSRILTSSQQTVRELKEYKSKVDRSGECVKESVLLNSDNSCHNGVDEGIISKFSPSAMKAGGKKIKMKRALSDSVTNMEVLEDNPSVTKKRRIVDDCKRQDHVDRSSGDFLHSVNNCNETNGVDLIPQRQCKMKKKCCKSNDDDNNNNGIKRLSKDKDKEIICRDILEVPSLDDNDHDITIGNGESTKSHLNHSEDETKDAKITVGPSRQRHHSLSRRSGGKKRCSNSNSHKKSPAFFSTSTSPLTLKKPLIYQRINNECYVAVDCEMVGVGVGGVRSALGRCSIVDYDGAVLYDKYIQCEHITDFRTIYSGITPKHLETAEPFETAIQDIHDCLKNKVIVAHDIRNDLKAMLFNPHRYLVRDTSRCHMLSGIARQNGYDGQENNLIPLKALAKTILGKDIQMGSKGHDSVEDARTAMELFRRVRNGWEKMLFAKWSIGEGLNTSDMVNALHNREDVRDADGIRITDFRCNRGGDDNQFEQDYLSDDFWPAM